MIYVALPIMDEFESLPKTIECILKQTYSEYKIICCVNQPEYYINQKDKEHIYHNNQKTLFYLESLKLQNLVIIDKSSKGKGWQKGKEGVGMARKNLMDFINKIANIEDIIISLDADTIFSENYFKTVAETMKQNKDVLGISAPYYHPLTENEQLDRAMLRYEIYMRSYLVNLFRIKSPYCFTALGSAIVITIKAYRKIGGISPKKSGEDFYLLQRLVKAGKILNWIPEIIFPATRFSDRVFFGTGPALIKGNNNNWESYPIYSMQGFNNIKNTYSKFELLFTSDVNTSLDAFIDETFGKKPWEDFRKNFKEKSKFVRACHEKIDGLRILQFLKKNQPQNEYTDFNSLIELLEYYKIDTKNIKNAKTLNNISVIELDRVRNQLFDIEMSYRYKN